MHEDEPVDLIIEPPHGTGVWANMVELVRSEHEFTLDFARIDYSTDPPRRARLVARVAMSSVLVTRLIDLLDHEWREYTREAVPDEVYDDGTEEEKG